MCLNVKLRLSLSLPILPLSMNKLLFLQISRSLKPILFEFWSHDILFKDKLKGASLYAGKKNSLVSLSKSNSSAKKLSPSV